MFAVVLYVLLFGLLLCCAPLTRLFRALDRPRQVYLGGLLAVGLVAQVINDPEATYPAAAFNMYSRRADRDPVYADYVGITRSGARVDLDFTKLFPTRPGRNVNFAMYVTAGWLWKHPDDPAHAEKLRAFASTLRSLAARYNAAHPDDPVVSVETWRCRLPLDDYRGTSSIEREPAWTFPAAQEFGS